MPNTSTRRLLIAAGLAALVPLQAAQAQGSDWPKAKSITWIVGFVPGGSVDALTRAFAKSVSAQIGQTIVVDNRPGASGALALQAAARAPGDGYTFVTVPGPIVHGRPQPEIGKALAAVGLISQGPIVMVGTSANASPDLQALIAAMKKNPDQWSYASSGMGTGQHLAGELFNKLAGTRMLHVPYKGGGQAVSDIIGGQVGIGMLGVTPVLPHIRAGTLKAYAVTTPFRIPSLPDVPTMDEAGLKGYEATQYFVMAAPAGIDPAVVTRLNVALAAAAATPEVVQALEAGGQVFTKTSPSEAEQVVLRSQEKFGRLAESAHIKVD